jgi:hypothetical protein
MIGYGIGLSGVQCVRQHVVVMRSLVSTRLQVLLTMMFQFEPV